MARYEHLPIYKRTFDLNVYLNLMAVTLCVRPCKEAQIGYNQNCFSIFKPHQITSDQEIFTGLQDHLFRASGYQPLF